MIPDLTLLLDLFGAADGDINVANTQASKAGKSGRSAVALKAIRMIRFTRLLRVLRVFKFFQTEDDADSEEERDPVDAGSSKVGQIVSESVTKKVIVLVLVLVLVLPWMDPSGASYGDAATTASKLFSLSPSDTTLQVLSQIGVPILKIVVDGTEYVNRATIIESRRTVEMWRLSLNENDFFIFDIRDSVEQEALLGMALTIFAILIFATSTLFVTASTMSLVVQPIVRLTELLMRMAGIIGVLGGAQTVENLMEDKDELFIVEALCERIMDIFGGGNQSYSGTNKKSSKALSMMASRKITQITSGDRVWEIDVKEKHRTSVIERRVKRCFSDFVNEQIDEEDDDEDNDAEQCDEDEIDFKELRSLEEIVENPITSYLTINNLLFILEADEWKTEMRSKFNRIYHKYCDDRSPAQINLNANMFDEMAEVEQGGVIRDFVFDKAVAETWQIMELNVFNQFLASDHCKFYMHMKKTDPLTLNQLQLSVRKLQKPKCKNILFDRASTNTEIAEAEVR